MPWLRDHTGRALARVTGATVATRSPAIEQGSIGLRQPLAEPIMASARGNVFDFSVHVTLNWMAQGLSHRQLRKAIRANAAKAVHGIDLRVARVTRMFHPQQVEEVEEAIVRDFREHRLCYYWARREVRCHPTVRVELDLDVREALRPSLLERMRLEMDHDTKMRRADLVDHLSQRWSELLQLMKDNPLIVHAADLTAEDFAQVIRDMDGTRQQHTDELLNLLQQAVTTTGDLSIRAYEWVQAMDRVLKRQPGADEAFPQE